MKWLLVIAIMLSFNGCKTHESTKEVDFMEQCSKKDYGFRTWQGLWGKRYECCHKDSQNCITYGLKGNN